MKKITLLLFLFTGILSFAQPVNDLCADAIVISGDGVINGTTVGATTDAGFPSPCGSASITSPGVWYMFTDTSGSGSPGVTVNTCSGTSYDSKISVYVGGSCAAHPR